MPWGRVTVDGLEVGLPAIYISKEGKPKISDHSYTILVDKHVILLESVNTHGI